MPGRRASAFSPIALLVAAGALMAGGPAAAQEVLTVELGDVSLTKLPFIMAADYGIYEKNNLKIRQYITPSAAKAIEAKGVKVPAENIGREEGIINIGGGSPTMVRMHSVATAPQRVILATTDIYSRYTSWPVPTSRPPRTSRANASATAIRERSATFRS